MLLLAMNATALSADEYDDVVITTCKDDYTFVMKDGKPMVKNVEKTEYKSVTDRSVTVYPMAFYGEFISLDAASGKGTAEYRVATPENVFYDDTKVCYYQVPLPKRNKTTTSRFERTFKEVRYFTRVMIPDQYLVENKTITFRIPVSMSQFRLHERNFTPNIKVTRALEGNDSVFTYTVTNLPRIRSEANAPRSESIYPYILITGSFKDYKEMHAWGNALAQVDRSIPGMDAILKEVNEGAKTKLERIKNTYAWVQKNIRYVAFEAGITGHQPDKPAEVVRKRFGDCKGKSLLLCTLLKQQGVDARLVDIGTREIAFKQSEIPTLAAVNHAICAVFEGGKTYWLDATSKFLPIEYVPGNLQGCEAVVEQGNSCVLHTLPVLPVDAATDSLTYRYKMIKKSDGSYALKGTVKGSWSGDMKEWFLRSYDASKTDDKATYLSNMLNNDDHTLSLSKEQWVNKDSRAPRAEAKAEVENSIAVQSVEKEVYLELNPHNNLFSSRIDTLKRVNDFELPERCRIVREVSVELPAGCKVQCPKAFKRTLPQGYLSCTFMKKGNQVTFKRVMHISNTLIKRKDIAAWNEALHQWNEASNEQVVLTFGAH